MAFRAFYALRNIPCLLGLGPPAACQTNHSNLRIKQPLPEELQYLCLMPVRLHNICQLISQSILPQGSEAFYLPYPDLLLLYHPHNPCCAVQVQLLCIDLIQRLMPQRTVLVYVDQLAYVKEFKLRILCNDSKALRNPYEPVLVD